MGMQDALTGYTACNMAMGGGNNEVDVGMSSGLNTACSCGANKREAYVPGVMRRRFGKDRARSEGRRGATKKGQR